MKAKYTKKQIQESIKHWQKMLEDLNETEVPGISSIEDFLNLCKEKKIEVTKAKVKKQGKIINATIADEDKEIKSREGKEIAKKGDLIVSDGDDTFYAVNSNDIPKYYELDKDGKSSTGDQTKWKKIGKELEYYITPFDVDVKVQWQDKPLHAAKGYSLVCNDKEGKDISPVAPKVFNDRTLWIKENKVMKYTKKQIQESIKHWEKVLESMEADDDQLLETDGNYTVAVELKGNVLVDLHPNHFYKYDTVDQMIKDAYMSEIWLDYARGRYGDDVIDVRAIDTSKPISGGNWISALPLKQQEEIEAKNFDKKAFDAADKKLVDFMKSPSWKRLMANDN